jgi:hypothetical protein
MHVSASAYPWDVARLGVERVLDDFVEQGIHAMDLAATYHPIEALSPREGTRVYSSPRGAVHFPARPERYGRIQPLLSSEENCGTWPLVVERARAVGITVNAWTVTLFQPWICDAYPDAGRVLPSGDAAGTGVCPANEDFREYLATLSADVVDQFGVDVVRLESVMPLGFNIDWLRPRVLVTVSPLARELLTLCFCPTCVRRGTDAGLDAERLRDVVLETIAAELAGRTDGPTIDGLRADDELVTFLAQHEQASIELVAAVRDALPTAPPSTPPRIASTIRTPFSKLRPGVADELTAALAQVVDQLSVGPGGGERNLRIKAIAAAAPHPVELTMLITRGLQLAGFGIPSRDGEDAGDPLPGQVAEACALGVSEVGLYNYGLLRDEDVRFFMDTFRDAVAAAAGPST